MNDDNLYLEVTEEVTNGKIDPALWAEAIAKALGDEDKGKYEYINLRVKQIREAPRQPDPQSGDTRYMPPGTIATQPQNNPPDSDESGEPFNVVDEEPTIIPGTETSEAKERTGVFHKLIQGRYGLAKTYWGFAIGLGFLFYFFSFVIGSLGSPTLTIIWILGLYSFQIIVWIGVWRAADQYNGLKVWSGLAKFAVIMGVLMVLGQLANTFNPA